jgi:hypothetical protein
MFATRIVETNPWYKSIIAPKGKSFFFRLFWWLVALGASLVALVLGYIVLTNEELKSQLIESFNLFKNG